MLGGSRQRLRQCAAILGLLYILLLDPAVVVSAPLSVNDMHPEVGCYYNLELYDHGEQIRTNEPCLNCTCTNHMLMCYLNTCPYSKPVGSDCEVERLDGQCCPSIKCPEVPVFIPDSQPFVAVGKPPTTTISWPTTTDISLMEISSKDGCYFDGTLYPEGHLLPSIDPCELCYCIRNHSACVMQNCTLKIPGCMPHYKAGVCCPVSYDCESDAIITTTTTTTTTTGLPVTGCYVDDVFYYDGSIINTGGPCQHCYCMKGEVICAVQECSAPEMDGCTAILGEDRCCPFKYECPVTESPITAEKASDEDVTTVSSVSDSDVLGLKDEEKESSTSASVASSHPFQPLDDQAVAASEVPYLEGSSQQPQLPEETDDRSKTTQAEDEVSGVSTELPKEQQHTELGFVDEKPSSTTEVPERVDSTTVILSDDDATVPADVTDSSSSLVDEKITTTSLEVTTKKDIEPGLQNDEVVSTAASISETRITSADADSSTAKPIGIGGTELPVLSDDDSYTPNTVPDDAIDVFTESSVAFSGEPEAKFSPDIIEPTSAAPTESYREQTDATIVKNLTTLQPQRDTTVVPDAETTSLPQDDSSADEDKTPALSGMPELVTTGGAGIEGGSVIDTSTGHGNTEVSYTVASSLSTVSPIEKPSFDQGESEDRIDVITTELPMDSSKVVEISDGLLAISQPADNYSEATTKASTSANVSTDLPDLAENATTRIPAEVTAAMGSIEHDVSDVKVPSDATSTESPYLADRPDDDSHSLPEDPIVEASHFKGQCHQDGVLFNHGETVPSKDFCQSNCSCQNSVVECQKVSCEIPDIVKNLTCRELFEDGRCCPRYICGHTEGGHGIFSSESLVTLLPPMAVSEEATIKHDAATAAITELPIASPQNASITESAPIVTTISASPADVTEDAGLQDVTRFSVDKTNLSGDYSTSAPNYAASMDDTSSIVPVDLTTLKDRLPASSQATVVFSTEVSTSEHEAEQETTVALLADDETVTSASYEPPELKATLPPQMDESQQDATTTVLPLKAEVEQDATLVPPKLDEDYVERETTVSLPTGDDNDDHRVTAIESDITSSSPLSAPAVTSFLTAENVSAVDVHDDDVDVSTSLPIIDVTQPANSSLAPPHGTGQTIAPNVTSSSADLEPAQDEASTESNYTDSSLVITAEPAIKEESTESYAVPLAVTTFAPLADEPDADITESQGIPIVSDDGLVAAYSTRKPILDDGSTVAPGLSVTDALKESAEKVTDNISDAATPVPPQANESSPNLTDTDVPQNDSYGEYGFPERNITLSTVSSPPRVRESTTFKPDVTLGDAVVAHEKVDQNLSTDVSVAIENVTSLEAVNETEISTESVPTRDPVLKDEFLAPVTVSVTEVSVPVSDVTDRVPVTTSTLRPPVLFDDVLSTTFSAEDDDVEYSRTQKPSSEQAVTAFVDPTKPDYSTEYKEPVVSTAEPIEFNVTGVPHDQYDQPGLPSTQSHQTTSESATSHLPGVETRLPDDERTSTIPSVTRDDSDVTTTRPYEDATKLYSEMTTLDWSRANVTVSEYSIPTTKAVVTTEAIQTSNTSAAEQSEQSTTMTTATTLALVVDRQKPNMTFTPESSTHRPLAGYDEHVDAVSPDAGIPITSDNFTLEEGQCVYESRLYSSAQQIPREDPCDFCFCFRGDIICLQQSCPPPIKGCYEEEIPGFCCPRYECPITAVTLNVTDPRTPPYPMTANRYRTVRALTQLQVVVCEFHNKFYNKGEAIALASGPCMDCLCGERGTMKCTPKKCQLDPLWQSLPNLRRVNKMGVTRLGRNRF